ncbi:hypothetical protein Tco_1284843 [Tanacetum coccineum]
MNNGNYDSGKNDSKLLDEKKDEGIVGLGSPPANKGRGLKKWRRIRRESSKDTSSGFDSNKKRGMDGLAGLVKQKSEGSRSSTNDVLNIVGLPRGVDYSSRADSENSRSSTAASVPRPSYEMNVVRSLSGRNSGSGVLKDQREKSPSVSKKARGRRIKKENSISSMESDSRSSNFVFAQGVNSGRSNGRRSGRSGIYEENDSDDARNGEGRLSEGGFVAFSKNEADSGDLSRDEKVDDDHVGSGDRNALVDSIMPLHLAQEALEREVQKLRDIGLEDILLYDDSVQPSGSSFLDEESQSSKSVQKQDEVHMQNKLEEALDMLKLKDTKICELESTLSLLDIKTEHEEILTKRIAAELEYLVIIKTIENMKADHVGQSNLTVNLKNVTEASPVHAQLEVEDANKLKKTFSSQDKKAKCEEGVEWYIPRVGRSRLPHPSPRPLLSMFHSRGKQQGSKLTG